MEKDFDYKRIFIDNKEIHKPDKAEKFEKRKRKEQKYISMFFVQSVICIVIIGSVIAAKYTTPRMFVSVSSALNGLYENNITLSDLNKLIDEKLSENETVAAFFNFNSDSDINGD